jgi:hypothetical protein
MRGKSNRSSPLGFPLLPYLAYDQLNIPIVFAMNSDQLMEILMVFAMNFDQLMKILIVSDQLMKILIMKSDQLMKVFAMNSVCRKPTCIRCIFLVVNVNNTLHQE